MGRPKKHDDGTESTRLPKWLMRRFRTIATHQDISVPDYIIKVMDAPSRKDFERAMSELPKMTREKNS
jgi:hypothetical protein